jgi:hypothetical protein
VVFAQFGHTAPTRRQLHQAVTIAGQRLTLQALDKRFTPAAHDFLLALLSEALCLQAALPPAAASVLTHFKGVYLLDATTLASGDKLLTRLLLTTGQMTLEVVPARQHENRVALTHADLPEGSLRLADLGFFDLATFAQVSQQHGYWLTRYKTGTHVLDAVSGEALDLLALLPTSGDLCLPVRVGKTQRLPAYLVARRVRPEQARSRRDRRTYRAQRKQTTVSGLTLALADWELYLTNIPDLSVERICALAHARWQIELVFKSWKSFWGLAQLPTADPIRQRCLLYAQLLALWLAHVLLTLDAHPNRSWWYAAQTLRDQAMSALRSLRSPRRWRRFLLDLIACLPLTSRLSKRRAKPYTHQVLTACA